MLTLNDHGSLPVDGRVWSCPRPLGVGQSYRVWTHITETGRVARLLGNADATIWEVVARERIDGEERHRERISIEPGESPGDTFRRAWTIAAPHLITEDAPS